MSWGHGEWGHSPWGGGEPSALGDVLILSVRFVTDTLLRLNLTTGVVVNAQYLSADNYQIAVKSDTPRSGTPVNVLRVLPPQNDALAVDYVYLETTRHTQGADYEATFNVLTTLDGANSTASNKASYASRITKTMAMLNSLPQHFDKRVDALIFNLTAAISLQDDDIGGSRSDDYD